MAPRPGGESDKFGNRYEGAWTVRQALNVLLGRGESIVLEPASPLGDGVEFLYRRDGVTQAHQVKRQHRNANSWSVHSLREKGVWDALRFHVEGGRTFHFVSTVPARAVEELTDRARRSDDAAAFRREWLSDGLGDQFDALASAAVYGSAEVAWRMLRGLWVEWHNERELIDTNAVLAEQVLTGAPGHPAALTLGDVLLAGLGSTLDAPALTSRLAVHGLRPAGRAEGAAVAESVAAATRSWAATVEPGLLRPVIARAEADLLVERVTADGPRLTLLTGTAGSGKSAVLHQAVGALTASGTPVLAFRLDRLAPFDSTHRLGRHVKLAMSPVGALATAAAGRPCVLVVDQLDAVSLVSGRSSQAFGPVADLIGEAAAFPAMRVVLVCRAFDAKADPRIRELASADDSVRLEVGSLASAQVNAALVGMGLDPGRLTSSQRALLGSPLHLFLLAQLADRPDVLTGLRSRRQLLDAFWEFKRGQCDVRLPSTRFHRAVSAVAATMSERQQLFVPDSVLDTDDLAASGRVLVSENVLVRDGRKLAFFHESFFDYAFARDWLRRNDGLVEFLTGAEQELFRRGQLRQVLDHLREQDEERFAEEVEALLTAPGIRYHLKEVVLAVLRGLPDPTAAEWGAVSRVLAGRPPFMDQVVNAVRSPAWFRRADDEGVVADWLAGADSRERDWAIQLLGAASDELPDRVAQLLEPHTAHPQFGSWLAWIIRFARIGESRPLFDLLLGAVRAGRLAGHDRDLWVAVDEFADEQPAWAVELIGAQLIDGPDALRLDKRGRVAALESRDHFGVKVITAAALGAPAEYCLRVLPALVRVMAATAMPRKWAGPAYDRHFSLRSPEEQPGDLAEALYHGAAAALRAVAAADPAGARELLAQLAAAPFEAAVWLVYRTLASTGEALAPWAAALLLEGRHRLFVGYASHSTWGARDVLVAIGGALPDTTLADLERLILHLRLPHNGELSPWHEFSLLSALPEDRLSAPAGRRLGELRRLLDRAEPDAPQAITAGFARSPIPSESARQMSDDQWLAALKKHSQDRTDWSTGTGGAHELALVLQGMTEREPVRFARLALRIDAGTHPAYGSALLRGLGDTERLDDPEPLFAAVRHFAGQRRPAHDRWLGWAVRRHLDAVPIDLVEALLRCALESDDPTPARTATTLEDSDGDLFTSGINTVRGTAAEFLGDLLLSDPDGTRAALLLPHVEQLAADPSPAVRTCVAHLLHAALRHDRATVARAFDVLVQAPDPLLASRTVLRLFVALCDGDPAAGHPVIDRMLRSEFAAVRRAGGQVAALAAMDWETNEFLAAVLGGDDGPRMQGAAEVCAQRLTRTGDAAISHHALVRFFHHPDEEVREAAATVAAALRGHRLAPVRATLTALMESRAFEPALPQLLITLDDAPDRIDELALTCVRRFLKVFGKDAADLRTGAAADAHRIGELLVRAHARATPRSRRAEILDLMDELLLTGAFGVTQAITEADRD
ncbi:MULTISPECIES: ATP-binding protein [Kitasatospora]|uniref:AAA+ ATPase domain-containing protein n=1 Tax=Kitasatospora setae (strain ATCC 33774 / DSM 43861 / JCM 3304 / KCC A-0304 / NBRC 14216 / KM-6054) TaxID=452652 RepID=E4N5Z7_KITSK|nr:MULTISPECIES: ATP-binding protein [Kitasatospora]BAJ26628.1 hypothetical protein KSE_07890 [Kitasatospora setae KM-6054]